MCKLKTWLKPSNKPPCGSEDRRETSGHGSTTFKQSQQRHFRSTIQLELLKNNTSLKKYSAVVKTKSTDRHVLFSTGKAKECASPGCRRWDPPVGAPMFKYSWQRSRQLVEAGEKSHTSTPRRGFLPCHRNYFYFRCHCFGAPALGTERLCTPVPEMEKAAFWMFDSFLHVIGLGANVLR